MTDDTDPQLVAQPELVERRFNELAAKFHADSHSESTMVLHRFKARFFFAWYDWWIGAYWDRKERLLYLCPLPMVGLKIVLPRDWLRKLRQHKATLPLVACGSIALGLVFGALFFHQEAKPAITFDTRPLAPLVSASAVAVASSTSSASLERERERERERDREREREREAASSAATRAAPSVPTPAKTITITLVPTAPRVVTSASAAVRDYAADRFDTPPDTEGKRR